MKIISPSYSMVLTRYKIPLRKSNLPKGSLRIAFISDLHEACTTADRHILEELLERANPHLFLCGGDMMTAHPKSDPFRQIHFLQKLAGKYQIYYALGNHEYRARLYPETYGRLYHDFIDPLKEAGIIFLDNEKIDLNIHNLPISLYGYTLPRKYYHRLKRQTLPVADLRQRLLLPSKKRINLLLAHNPVYLETYARWGADISFCGHFHGGIVRLGKHVGLIGPDFSLFTPKAYGHYNFSGHHVLITSGAGEHTIPLRIFNPRELVLVELQNRSNFLDR